MNQQKVNIHSDNTDDESSMNNDNDKSVLRAENKHKNGQAKLNVCLHNNIIWIHNTMEIILATLQMNYGHQKYFDDVFDKLFYEHIAEQIKLYSVQVTGNSIKTDENEIQQFIGILTLMGIFNYLQYKMYWSQFKRCPSITEIMSMKRFKMIELFFHVSDNNEMPKK